LTSCSILEQSEHALVRAICMAQPLKAAVQGGREALLAIHPLHLSCELGLRPWNILCWSQRSLRLRLSTQHGSPNGSLRVACCHSHNGTNKSAEGDHFFATTPLYYVGSRPPWHLKLCTSSSSYPTTDMCPMQLWQAAASHLAIASVLQCFLLACAGDWLGATKFEHI
jgi:hypothetical protein